MSPIKPENRKRYPKNWTEIRLKILDRAGNRCEFCGVENYALGYRRTDRKHYGEFVECTPMETEAMAFEGDKTLQIILTIAHYPDKTIENCSEDNLKALCQRCHLEIDKDQHKQSRFETKKQKQKEAGQQFMFEEKCE